MLPWSGYLWLCRLFLLEDEDDDEFEDEKEWRMGRDSNPRYLAVHTLSRRAQSTALAPIRNEPTSLVSIADACNPFVTP